MSEEKEKLESDKKQPYSPPRLRVIELVTDEVLGTGCKTVSDIVPTGVCGSSPCGSQIGS